jgi:hypothetical protein
VPHRGSKQDHCQDLEASESKHVICYLFDQSEKDPNFFELVHSCEDFEEQEEIK